MADGPGSVWNRWRETRGSVLKQLDRMYMNQLVRVFMEKKQLELIHFRGMEKEIMRVAEPDQEKSSIRVTYDISSCGPLHPKRSWCLGETVFWENLDKSDFCTIL